VKIPPLSIVPIDKIQVDLSNPNDMNDKQFNALKENIKKYGFLVPLILNKEYVIADGEHRFLAAKDLGMTELPAIVLDISEVDRHIIRQVMNKLKGEHDPKMDEVDYKWILDNDGFSELKKLLALSDKAEVSFLASLDKVKDDDYEGSVNSTSIQNGDLFLLGPHRLLCGDSTKKEDVELALNNTKVDLLLTDPPYGVDYGTKNAFLNKFDKGNSLQDDIRNDELLNEDFQAFCEKWITPIQFNEYNASYIFIASKTIHLLINALEKHGYYYPAHLVWVKNQQILGRADYSFKHEDIVYAWKGKHKFYSDKFPSTILNFDKPRVSDLHPTMKPVEILTELIHNSSTEGMTVYDPFGGSGSTLIACQQTNRKCVMIEIMPKYVQTIINRWENLTGLKAQKVN
jgi:DNA modification methylase